MYRRDSSNRKLNEHGIYIQHCQESNSQPVPSQVRADSTRPQWRTAYIAIAKHIRLLITEIWTTVQCYHVSFKEPGWQQSIVDFTGFVE